ncbi:Tetratricopeptide TPR_1 repeat-containing protein [Halothece sp. PCC 7418]|uniref:tetratricopeptide repeat protein n=1 Tax=Halothece sp. (strain PCC 7418) TaxID=65093 RepID=UPI0002A07972|nr:tetratricopeptide repeat protein [Halothece sp. PCC 7418]AFZ43432.1 Tetratricopeptide TPR_1 repeat-containing protein [Halothece sp. PCC 7418]
MSLTADSNPLQQEAETYLDQQRFQQAISLCQQMIQETPQFAPAYQILGKASLGINDLQTAAKAYQHAIALEPNCPENYANLGLVRAQQQQWQEAHNCYQKALEIKPDFAGVYRHLARLWEQLNQLESAVEAWERAYSLEPETVKPEDRLRLGDDFLKLRQLDQAIASYQRALEAQPNWQEAYQRLGEALEKAGRWEEATATWKRAMQCSQQQENAPVVTSSPQKQETYKRACQTHLEQQQWSEAVIAGKKALSIAEDAQTWHWVGKALQMSQKPQEASVCYRNAIALQPLPESYTNLGSLYAQQQQWQNAVRCYQEALKLDSQQAVIWRNLGRALTGAGETQKAVAAWYRAYCLAPTEESAEDHLQLGDRLAEWGHLTEAIRCYQYATERKPNWSLAYYRLGDTLQKAQRWEEATVSLRRAIECRQQEEASLETITPPSGQGDLAQNFSETENNAVGLRIHLAEAFPTFRKGWAWLREKLPKRTRKPSQELLPALSGWEGKQPATSTLDVAAENPQEENDSAVAKPSQKALLAVLESQARACLEAKDLDRCFRVSQELVQEYPQYPQGYKLLGQVYQQKGELSLALEAYQNAIALQPEDVAVRVWCGQILVSLEQFQDAIAQYQKALQQEPKNWEIYHYLGDAWEASGDPDSAIAAYEKAVELASSNHKIDFSSL